VKTSPGSPPFRQSLLDFLQAGPRRQRSLLEQLQRDCGPQTPLYSTLLYLLTHLQFSERRASQHWQRIAAHQARLRAALSRDPGLRVAILDYFANVRRELRNPAVIEIASYERTERSAVTDGLTGLFNHAYFLQALGQELLRSRRHGRGAALLLLDLDDFKRLNDRRGHLEGDRALVRAAAVIRESVREIDVAARYGGEEFAVLLPDTTRLGALVVAERVRRRIEERFARLRPAVTVSGGIAVFPDDASGATELVARADAALYAAKAAGKNRILLPGSADGAEKPPRAAGRSRAPGAPGSRNARREDDLLVNLPDPLPVGSAVVLRVRPAGGEGRELRGRVVSVERVSETAGGGYDVAVRLAPARRPPASAAPIATVAS
jgi:diguanylate cyclase (GGDEF)-like protein